MNTDKGQFSSPDIYRKGNPADTIALAKRADEQNKARREARLEKSVDANYKDDAKSGKLGAQLAASGKTVSQAKRSKALGNPVSVSGAALAEATATGSTRTPRSKYAPKKVFGRD